MSAASRSRSSFPVTGIVLASAVLFAACSAAGPTPSPTVPPGAPATPTTPGVSPTAVPTAAPTEAPTIAPVASPLTLTWKREKDPATPRAGDWEQMGRRPAWTRLGDTYVLAIGNDTGPQVWVSQDALHWRPAAVPADAKASVSVNAVTTGGPGLIAEGQVTGPTDDQPFDRYWTSSDGETWVAVDQPPLTEGQIWLLNATAGGDVAWGGPVAVDGFTGPAWPGDLAQMAANGDTITGFVGDLAGKPVELWRSQGGAAWAKVATLPDSTGDFVQLPAHGPAGWFVLGCDAQCMDSRAWVSADGETWETVVASRPDGAENAIVGVPAGFVAVGQLNTGTGCATGDDEIVGTTWVSATGRRWREIAQGSGFDRAAIRALIPMGATLVGLGVAYPKDGAPASVAWTAALPASSSDEGLPAATPTPAPSPRPSGEGCN